MSDMFNATPGELNAFLSWMTDLAEDIMFGRTDEFSPADWAALKHWKAVAREGAQA